MAPWPRTCQGKPLKRSLFCGLACRNPLGVGLQSLLTTSHRNMSWNLSTNGSRWQTGITTCTSTGRLRPFGINSSQYLFILNLCRDPGITQDKLPERICVNKSNVARTLAQLEKKGLIRRQVNPGDKRTAAVFPTERARELYPRIMEVIATWDDAVTSVLSAQEKENLLEFMQRVADKAAALRGASPAALRK